MEGLRSCAAERRAGFQRYSARLVRHGLGGQRVSYQIRIAANNALPRSYATDAERTGCPSIFSGHVLLFGLRKTLAYGQVERNTIKALRHRKRCAAMRLCAAEVTAGFLYGSDSNRRLGRRKPPHRDKTDVSASARNCRELKAGCGQGRACRPARCEPRCALQNRRLAILAPGR